MKEYTTDELIEFLKQLATIAAVHSTPIDGRYTEIIGRLNAYEELKDILRRRYAP